MSGPKPVAEPSIVDLSTLPFPRFQLFEIAVMQWELDDPAIAVSELVQIVGLTWWPAGWRDAGWVYHVRNLYPPKMSKLLAGHQEDCAESELRKVAIQPLNGIGEAVVLRSA